MIIDVKLNLSEGIYWLLSRNKQGSFTKKFARTLFAWKGLFRFLPSMRLCRYYFRFILLLTLIPAIVLYPQNSEPFVIIPEAKAQIEAEDALDELINNYLFTYDDILKLLDEVENGELERFSEPELNRIIRFLEYLGKKGMLPDGSNEELILEHDIQELLNDSIEEGFSFQYESGDYAFVPAVSYYSRDVVLCKGWLQKKFSKIKRAIKKHKKAILIGAAVVAAAAVVVCVVAVASTAGAAALGSAGAAAATASDHGKKNKSAEESIAFSSSESPASPVLTEVIEQHVSSFKEQVVEEELLDVSSSTFTLDETSYTERTRELGAVLAHKTLEGISQMAASIPQLTQEIIEIGEKCLPGGILHSNNELIAQEDSYEKVMTAGHKKIDQVFSTDQAQCYYPENKDLKKDFTIGMLPPPSSGALMETGRISPTQASSAIGWKVGDSITHRTKFGNVPKWSTVRSRYWKNRAEWAKSNSHDYREDNIPRMEKGLAPQRINPSTGEIESMELHHNPAQRDGGLFDFIEVWPDDHALIDPKRHLGG